ncbi:MAG: hypothetical protein K0M39_03470 [Rhizobium sp.]|uniref:hypothetical protein n=1 Tax=Thiobacillus sp. TaxID=924 RepID=UPI0025D3A579|nr:hypothetical protein [Thiobacillus sp.]MBW8363590.1 hypothetical protein [Rhizobium sp.]
MKIRIHASTTLTTCAGPGPGQPLWQIAPTRDLAGKRLTDFMMLIPRLRSRPRVEIERASREIQAVLSLHQDVVFADLNLKLNLLWVSLRPRPGAISELVAAIRLRVPEAVLVAHYAEPR